MVTGQTGDDVGRKCERRDVPKNSVHVRTNCVHARAPIRRHHGLRRRALRRHRLCCELLLLRVLLSEDPSDVGGIRLDREHFSWHAIGILARRSTREAEHPLVRVCDFPEETAVLPLKRIVGVIFIVVRIGDRHQHSRFRRYRGTVRVFKQERTCADSVAKMATVHRCTDALRRYVDQFFVGWAWFRRHGYIEWYRFAVHPWTHRQCVGRPVLLHCSICSLQPIDVALSWLVIGVEERFWSWFVFVVHRRFVKRNEGGDVVEGPDSIPARVVVVGAKLRLVECRRSTRTRRLSSREDVDRNILGRTFLFYPISVDPSFCDRTSLRVLPPLRYVIAAANKNCLTSLTFVFSSKADATRR